MSERKMTVGEELAALRVMMRSLFIRVERLEDKMLRDERDEVIDLDKQLDGWLRDEMGLPKAPDRTQTEK